MKDITIKTTFKEESREVVLWVHMGEEQYLQENENKMLQILIWIAFPKLKWGARMKRAFNLVLGT